VWGGVLVVVCCGLGGGSLVHFSGRFSGKEKSFGEFFIIALPIQFLANFRHGHTWLSWLNSKGQEEGGVLN